MRFPTTTGTGRPVTRRFTGRSRRRGIVVTTAAVLAALLLAAAHAAGTVPDRESVHPAPSHAGSVAFFAPRLADLAGLFGPAEYFALAVFAFAATVRARGRSRVARAWPASMP
ncbi:hypothetical protein ACFUYE_26805 [Micromonospora humida]|uniref:hypothetical protein n=1 Tax=Micromonospora humida TaxID=2809018 RepID=UPI00366F13FF